ncbi:parvulin peptidyl-prolyl isomerase [Paludisphaera sp.]|uniref:parvulin peptidyl-prolyl isomerase n=1 Tax=Paludisphaera sp. TaxID=2017432 RepID=UPI00301B80D6
MIAKDGGRAPLAWAAGLTLAGLVAATSAHAQQARGQAARAQAPAGKASTAPAPTPVLTDVKQTAIPVNPTDAIAIVNDQVITRADLADECVARKGKEILETLINRALIEQALKAQKKEVTAAEIDQEIDSVAGRFGIGRQQWLQTLDKERGISPFQYARDVIYPQIAMRKLCEGRVQVTEEDLKSAFEAQYGDKIRARLIMVDTLTKAQAVWEELKKNPGGFEKVAQEQSMDLATRSLGGLLAEPINRFAQPRNVSDAAFAQLVDGDPNDKDPSHKPKDGDFTGPIQASEGAWVILRREGIIPAETRVSLKDENIRKMLNAVVHEGKLKQEMAEVFEELIQKAAIENKLVGTMKMANENQHPEFRVDDKVKLMSNPESNTPEPAEGAEGQPAAAPKLPTPAALADDAARFEKAKAEGQAKAAAKAAAPAPAPAPAAAVAPAAAPK